LADWLIHTHTNPETTTIIQQIQTISYGAGITARKGKEKK